MRTRGRMWRGYRGYLREGCESNQEAFDMANATKRKPTRDDRRKVEWEAMAQRLRDRYTGGTGWK